MPDRYPSSGLAHIAADALTASTGEQHRMAFEPRRANDAKPFVVIKVNLRDLGRVASTCLETAYGKTQRHSFQIKVF